jgi:hypothetical protein
MSTKLMTALSSCPIDLSATVGLNTVCIDNQDVRKRLLKNGKIEISVVPCLLIVYRSGGVEKYEGNAAFEWIDEAVSKYSPRVSDPLPTEPIHQNQVHANNPQPQKKEVHVNNPQPANRPSVVIEEDENEDENEYEDENEEEEVEYIPVPQPARKIKSVQKTKKETTLVEDLGFEPFEEKEFVVSENTVKNSIKGKDLLSTAAAMQKERDTVDSNSNKTKMKNNT